ncbi:hypothetical protein Q3G72_018124 [Acer saccharum]|nr:hypothetical protein Q3G72_018124 [Acer saccharum]
MDGNDAPSLHAITVRSERESDSLGREGSQITTNGRVVREDFRDGLFSIFIDNLNPEVDVKELWHFFKFFGRVRDVFLSNRFSHRRSSYAFVRFGSWAEANLVAESVNGRLIRGWSIVSKMANFGWKSRRSVVLRQSGSRMVDGEVGKVNRMFTGSKKGHQRMRSFAEVVYGNRFKGNDECAKVSEEGISMTWDSVDKEDLWLSRCTIGVLKKFTEVAYMISRVRLKGFSFQTNYLGDKLIIWRFDSVEEKIRFMSESSLWEDYFVSMNEWSDEHIPKFKLLWIKCWGVSLSC